MSGAVVHETQVGLAMIPVAVAWRGAIGGGTTGSLAGRAVTWIGRCLVWAGVWGWTASRTAAADSPGALPADAPPVVTIRQFLDQARDWGEQRVVRLQGTVTAVLADRTFFVQDGEAGIYIFDRPTNRLDLGQWVEVTGHPSLGNLAPLMDGTGVRVLGRRELPAPVTATPEEVMAGRHHMRRVRMHGRLAAERPRGRASLVLQAGTPNRSFFVDLESVPEADLADRLAPGSLLEVTGVCNVRADATRTRPVSFTLFPGTPADVVLVRGPPFWTQEKVLVLLLLSVVGIGLAMSWVWTLRRQVRRRTADLRAQLEVQVALERRFVTVFRASPDATFIARSSDGRILEVNLAFEQLFGFEAAEAVGRTTQELGIWVQPERLEALMARLREGVSVVHLEAPLQTRGGQRLTVVTSAQLIDYGGEPCLLSAMRDLTAQKKAEREQARLERQLEQTRKLESLGILAGGIAHDFNNLLTAVAGNLGVALLDLEADHPARQPLVDAQKATRRAADLVRQMLAYSGKGHFVVRKLRLSEVAEDLKPTLQAAVPRTVTLRFNFAERNPVVEADVTQLRQILLNLVINGSDAIGDRGGTITVSTGVMACDRAYLTATWLHDPLPEGLYAFLEVADDGCGISPEDLPRIFDPFFTTKFAGRGLGLATVLGIVRGHKGALKVYSEVDRGTTFKILLPAVGGAADPLNPPVIEPTDWRGAGRILLVDDEESIRVVGRRMLQRLGFEVQTAANGCEALEAIEKAGGSLACVLLDLTMPQMDGAEACREMRRRGYDVPVVLSSGFSEPDVARRFAGLSPAGFVSKPYTLATLQEALQRALASRLDSRTGESGLDSPPGSI